MTRTDTTTPRIEPALGSGTPAAAPGVLIEIGAAIFPVYGNASVGWSIEQRDISEHTPYRYASLDELVFAVLNFCVHARGSA